MTQHSRNSQHAPRPFTGRHMAMIMIAFFGVVIAVNVLMARFAVSTFGGVVVENSYVASQHFNRWLDEARVEGALGWKAVLSRTADGRVIAELRDSAGKPLSGAKLTATAEHPLGRRPETELAFRESAPGTYAAALEPGRWRLRLAVTAEGHEWRTVGEVQ